MQRAEQAGALRELAKKFEEDPNFEFTCNKVANILGYEFKQKYAEIFDLGIGYNWDSENVDELWTRMTPQERQDQRVMMLCFMAAIIEEKRQPVRGPG